MDINDLGTRSDLTVIPDKNVTAVSDKIGLRSKKDGRPDKRNVVVVIVRITKRAFSVATGANILINLTAANVSVIIINKVSAVVVITVFSGILTKRSDGII